MQFIGKKLFAMLVVLFIVSGLTFLLVAQLPGKPCITVLGIGATAEGCAKVNKDLGLDRPLPVRYAKWVQHTITGDLGKGIQNGTPVTTLIKQGLPVTLELLVLSQLIALIIAIPLGIYAAYRPDGIVDRIATTTTFGLLAAPSFVVGVFFVALFAVQLRWFPAIGFISLTKDPVDNLKHVALPAITLALPELAAYMRLLRADMIATLQEDYITMAKSKGLPTWYILVRHALRPSTFSTVTVAGLNFGRLIGGTIIVETLFAQPGIGALTVGSIQRRDFPTVQGTVLVIAAGYVFINFLVDLLYAVIDPRVRHARSLA